MHTFYQFLVQGAVGFAIGAGTNDLAIRWVFWALFAKKKQAIANAVQSVVSRELMSPDKIAARLASPEVAEGIRDALDETLSELASRPLPSLDALAGRYSELRIDALRAQLGALIADTVACRLAQPSFCSEVLRPFLDEQWVRFAPKRPMEILPASTRDLLAGLPECLAGAVLAPEHRARLCSVIAGGVRSWMADYPTPASFLGPANCEELTRLAGSRTRLLGEELAVLLETPPAQVALRDALRCSIQTHLSSLGVIGTLLSGFSGAALVEAQLAKFCSTLPTVVRSQVAREEEAQRLRGLIETAVRKLLDRTWAELFDADTSEVIERHVAAVLSSDAVRDMARNGFASVTASLLDNVQGSTLSDISKLAVAEGNIASSFDWLAETLHNAIRSSDLKPALERQAGAAMSEFCKRPIGAPGRFLSDGARSRLVAFFADGLTAFARDNVAVLSEKTRLWDIISESIIVYDEKKMERIVRGVANRELRWVTLLGGVIGLVAGIAQGVLLLILDR